MLALLLSLLAGAHALATRLEQARRHRPVAARATTLEGRVDSVVRVGSSVRILLSRVQADVPLPSRVQLDAPETPGAALARALPGEHVRLRARIAPPRERANPGRRGSVVRRLARAGVGAVARPLEDGLQARLVDREGWRPLASVYALRQRARGRLEAEGRGGALLAALALGERGGLTAVQREAFARVGVAHLLAVSGLHLALVAAAAYGLARWLLLRPATFAARFDVREPALLLALVVALAQALLAGWGVPVRRALVFVSATALALARGRPGRRGQPLALAGLWVLAREPQALFEAGAQMSFAASAALVLARRPLPDAAAPSRRTWLEGPLRASATAIVVTAPLAAWHLGVAAPLALLANAWAVPWTGALLLPLALLCALAAGCAPALLPPLLALALPLACGTLDLVAWLARHGPGPASVSRPSPWVCALLLALAGAALAARRLWSRLGAASACTLLLAASPLEPVLPARPRAVFLDVGQGDAVIVQGGAATLVVDAGSAVAGRFDLGRSTVLPALRALGVDAIDLLVASHADLDHRGGLPALLGALPVRELWLPRGGRRDPGFAQLLEAAGRAGVRLAERGAGDPARRFGDVLVTPLWPPRGAEPASRNDASLVVRIDVSGHSLLLAGDVGAHAERALVASGAPLAVDVLLLPHHGSRSSSSSMLLRAARPRLGVVSAPCGGRYGMPHPEVVARVQRVGLPLWWTGRDGAVVVGLRPRLVARGWGPPASRCASVSADPR